MGQAGSEKVQRLKSSLGEQILAPGPYPQNSSFVLSIFFDTASRLQKVSTGIEVNCSLIEGVKTIRAGLCKQGNHANQCNILFSSVKQVTSYIFNLFITS